MRRSIATVSLCGTLEEKLAAAAAAHFDGVEIFENDLLYFGGSPRQVRALADDLGLKVVLYQPFRDLEGVTDEQFRRNLDRIERKFDVMEALGAPLLLVCSNALPQAIDDDARAAAQLYEAADRAAKRGLRIGYEALAWGTRVKTYGQAWRIVERANHPHLGLILDSFHTLSLADDPTRITGIPGSRIFFVQMADAPKLAMDVLSWSRHFRCFPGQGDLDVAGFLAQALRAGYAGPVSLEVFNDEFRASPTRPTALDGMRSLLFLEEQVRAALRADAAPNDRTRSNRRVELFDPPPAPELTGIAFVEFAVDARSEAALADWLGRLGFRCAGRHRTKDVSLYRQGEINIVLNAEPDSFAQSYFLMHGPSLCAIGVGTRDELQALNRAEAFECARYEGRVGPNEWSIPAVRSPAGSLLYFVAAPAEGGGPLDTDFIAVAAGNSPVEDAGLLAFDHLAHALPHGQLDSWILFYRSVLALEPEPVVVLADPYGLVHSRTVSSQNRAVRFPLNVSESHNTTTARSVSTFAGAGIHHIAFRTPDIFAAAARLQANGIPVLPIPANYYDDLAARFGLDADLLDRMQRHNILYDRSPAGEYLQVYTEAFERRFFFEIVQRRDAYDLYGAANAPVRMAAQAERDRQANPELVALL